MCNHSSKYSSEIEHYLHELTMDSGQDAEIGDVQEHGWFALFQGVLVEGELWDWSVEHDDCLTPDDVTSMLDWSGAILWEDNQGFVGADFYPTTDELAAAWSEIETMYQPEEDDE